MDAVRKVRATPPAPDGPTDGAQDRIYFVTDLHGSSKCFRKFLNAGPVYGADVMVLGGDVAGKAIQSIVRGAAANTTATSSAPTTRSTRGRS